MGVPDRTVVLRLEWKAPGCFDDVLEPLLPWRYLALHGFVELNVPVRVGENPAFRLFEKAARILDGQVLAVDQATPPLRRGEAPLGRRVAEVEADPSGPIPELQSGRTR